MNSELILIDYLISYCTTLDECRIVTDALSPDLFDENRNLYATCYRLVHEGMVPDQVILYDRGVTFDRDMIGKQFFQGMDLYSHIKTIKTKHNNIKFIENIHKVVDDLKSGKTLNEVKDSLWTSLQVSTTGVDIYDAQKQVDEYKTRVANIKSMVLKTGFPEIDNRIRGVATGEVLCIIGRAGSYKTALLQHILRNYIHTSDMASVFFSIEMPAAGIVERNFSMLTGWTGYEIEMGFAEMQGETTSKAETSYLTEYENFFIIDSKINLSDISAAVATVENEYKKPVGVIGIDYLGLVEAEGKSEYEKVSNIARSIKHLARQIKKPIVLLSQTSRAAMDGTVELQMQHGRGSGAIEEACDFLLGLWQEGEDDDKKLLVKILKNRKGPAGDTFVVNMDRSNFRFDTKLAKYERPKKESKVKYGDL